MYPTWKYVSIHICEKLSFLNSSPFKNFQNKCKEINKTVCLKLGYLSMEFSKLVTPDRASGGKLQSFQFLIKIIFSQTFFFHLPIPSLSRFRNWFLLCILSRGGRPLLTVTDIPTDQWTRARRRCLTETMCSEVRS